MQTITIIESVDGLPIGAKTFLLEGTKIQKEKKIKKAEKLFVTLAVENGIDAKDAEELIDAGHIEKGTYSVSLVTGKCGSLERR
jgi:hypothetical protein